LRCSVDSPHFQRAVENWPRDERDLFTADDKNHVLLSADYRQIEAVLTAFFARDVEQTEIVLAGGNLHAITAATFYGCEPTAESAKSLMVKKGGREESAYQCTKEYRHGRNFWMGAHTLSRKYGFTLRESIRLIQADDKRWPAVARWRPSVAWEAQRNKMLLNSFERPLYFHTPFRGDDIERWADAREAVAFKPQSTAGDMFKLATAALPAELMWSAAHDNDVLHVEADIGKMKKAAILLRDTMERCFPEMVWAPFYPKGFFCKVDITAGYSWGGKEKVEI